MKRIDNDKFKEIIYTDVLENGLQVFIIHKPEYASSSALFAVPYGSLDYQQTIGDNIFFVQPGAAHFLEHKLFEDEEGDIMGLFSAMGANVNAFTSYNETVYYFSTSNNSIDKPLNLLLDFVQQLRINDESVEKEKGIITQELLMYKQMPDSRLLNEALKALFHDFPLKHDIGGTVESVTAITTEELSKAYQYNYHPANMKLVIVTGNDPKHILDIVKSNQSRKTFNNFSPLKRQVYDEPYEVVNNNITINMDVSQPKVCLAYKMKVVNESDEQRNKNEWALRFIMESYFSGLNEEYQKWLDDRIITDYFGYDVDLTADYAILLFFNETDNIEVFKNTIDAQLKQMKKGLIEVAQINQLKKRYFGQTLRIFNNINDIGVSYVRSIINKIDLFRSIELINEVDTETILEALKRVDLNNSSLITIKKEGAKQDDRT